MDGESADQVLVELSGKPDGGQFADTSCILVRFQSVGRMNTNGLLVLLDSQYGRNNGRRRIPQFRVDSRDVPNVHVTFHQPCDSLTFQSSTSHWELKPPPQLLSSTMIIITV